MIFLLPDDLVGVGLEVRAAGESRVWACLFIVGIGDFYGVSMVVFGVTFLLFGGNCGDSFSTGLTGVGVSCTMLMVCFVVGRDMTVSLRY